MPDISNTNKFIMCTLRNFVLILHVLIRAKSHTYKCNIKHLKVLSTSLCIINNSYVYLTTTNIKIKHQGLINRLNNQLSPSQKMKYISNNSMHTFTDCLIIVIKKHADRLTAKCFKMLFCLEHF